jgi:hypothetical protein
MNNFPETGIRISVRSNLCLGACSLLARPARIGRVEQRQIEQRCHSALGCRRVPRSDRLIHTHVIRNRIARQLVVALLENRGPGYCRPNPADQRRHECIAAGAQQRRVEVLIGIAPLLHRKRMLFHVPQGLRHGGEIRLGPALGRERRSLRLDHAAQLEQALHQTIVRLMLENPGQDVRIQQMPALGQADPRAHLGTRLHQALGGQDAHGLAIGRARDLEPVAGVDLAIEDIPRAGAAGNDPHAQIARDAPVQTQCLAARRFRTCQLLLARHARIIT